MSEHVLAARVRTGDMQAFAAVYERYYQGLWRFIVRQAGSDELAHDIINAIFLGVWTHRARWNPVSVKAYLYGAARHELQKVARHRKVVDRTMPAVEEAYAEYGAGTSVVRPDEAAEFADLRDRVRRAIALLPERQRSAMLLRWVEGLTIAEIATAMGISHPPVVRLLARAQRTLRQALEPTDGDAM